MCASGVSWVMPMAPCICTASSVISSAMRGAITLICEIQGEASRWPTVSIM